MNVFCRMMEVELEQPCAQSQHPITKTIPAVITNWKITKI
jgi:hypothetical protein